MKYLVESLKEKQFLDNTVRKTLYILRLLLR